VKFNRHFLNVGLILSLIVPFIKYKVIVNEYSNAFGEIPNIPLLKGEILSDTEIYFSIYENLHYVYLAISTMFVVKLIINIFSFYIHIKPFNKKKEGNFILIENTESNSPFSFMNNVVYNPSLFSSTELKDILNHEKQHSMQKHSYDMIFMEFYIAFQWLNPVAWLYKKALIKNLEFLADSEAIEQSNNRQNYLNTMLKLSVPENRIKLASNFYDSIIKSRITLLNSNKSKKIKLMKSLLVIPVILVFIFQFNSESIAQNIEEDSTRYTVTEIVDSTLPETIDKLIENTPGYGKNSTPLYVIDGRLTNRAVIFHIQTENVKRVSLVKKEAIQQRYGIGASVGVVEIGTIYEFKGSKVVTGHKIPNVKMPLIIVNGKEYKKDPNTIVPDQIKSINEIKDPEEAKEKYGEKGKNGVIEVILKEGVTIE